VNEPKTEKLRRTSLKLTTEEIQFFKYQILLIITKRIGATQRIEDNCWKKSVGKFKEVF
jgi:hypothetical protein